MKIKTMIQISLFAVMTAIGARLTIPVPILPFTLQTMFAMLAGLVLGKKKGAASQLLYMLMGLAGIPVFTSVCGPAALFAPSFGYIIGFVLCAYVDDYLSGAIKKHELTRKEKEDDRMRHFRAQNANVEPVFLAFRDNEVLGDIIRRTIAGEPEYDFVAEDGIGHTLWIINDDATIAAITKAFSGIDAMYIADGHHRTAASVRIGVEKREQNPNHRGDEEYNYFMAVAFPQSELKIMDYNRVVKDLNGLTAK